jgi:acetylornithine deacetylase
MQTQKISKTNEILKNLIAFDTVSDKSNLPLLAYVEEYLAKFGIMAERVYDETGQKANLWATVGEATKAGYILSGHTDVVPVSGQNWATNPFELTQKGTRLYGRGTCDMKGFLACVLALVPEMLNLKTPIHLAFSHDEETGCIGVRSLLTKLAQQPVKPLGCFVGEPTLMEVVIGHKTKRSMRVKIKGKAAHSSLAPQGVSANIVAAKIMLKIEEMSLRLAKRAELDKLYDVAVSTANVGVMKGGEIINIVSEFAQFDFEFRCVAGDDVDALMQEVEDYAKTLLPAMQAVEPSCAIEFIPLSGIPGLEADPASEIVRLAKHFAKRNTHAKVAYGTEAGLFVEMAAIPSVICGPGSIDQAHKPDEYIEIAQLEACTAFLRGVISHCQQER